MSPKEAKVFIVEDNEVTRYIAKKSLEKGGHKISIVAYNLEGALEAVSQLHSLGVQVAIVDGNLTSGERSGRDGKAIVKAIRTHAPNVKIIGFSADRIKGVEGADVNIHKTDDVSELVTAVNEL